MQIAPHTKTTILPLVILSILAYRRRHRRLAFPCHHYYASPSQAWTSRLPWRYNNTLQHHPNTTHTQTVPHLTPSPSLFLCVCVCHAVLPAAEHFIYRYIQPQTKLHSTFVFLSLSIAPPWSVSTRWLRIRQCISICSGFLSRCRCWAPSLEVRRRPFVQPGACLAFRAVIYFTPK